MRDDIQKHIDPDLPPLGQMKQMEELVMDWPDPDWVKGWLETGHMERSSKERGNTGRNSEGDCAVRRHRNLIRKRSDG